MNRQPWRWVARRRNIGVVPAMACLLLLSGGSLASSSRRAERSPGALGPHFVATNRLSDSTPSEYELMLAQMSGDFGRKTSRSSSSEAAAAVEEPEYRGAETIVLPLYIPEHAVPIRLARIPRSGSHGEGDDDEETGSAEDADAKRGRAPKRSEAVLLRRLGPVARPLIRRPPTPIRLNANRNRSPPTPPAATKVSRSRIPLAARLPSARRPDFVSFRPFLSRSTSTNSPAPFNASRSFGARLAGSQAPSIWEGREELATRREGDIVTSESPEIKRTKKNEFSKDSQFPEELHTTTVPPSSATSPPPETEDGNSSTSSTTKRPIPSRIISRKVIRKPVASKAPSSSSSSDPSEDETSTKQNPTTSTVTPSTAENPDPAPSATTSAPVITTFSPKETHSPRAVTQEPETTTTKITTTTPNTVKTTTASSTTTLSTTPSTPATTSTTTTTTKKSQQGKRPSLIFPKPVSSILQSQGAETTTTTTTTTPAATTTTSAADTKVSTTASAAALAPTKGIGKGLTVALRNPPWLSRFRAREPTASHGPPPRKMPSVEEILNSDSRKKEDIGQLAKEEEAPKVGEEEEDEEEEEKKENRGPVRLRVRPQLPTIRFASPTVSTTTITTEPTTTTKQTTTTEEPTTTTTKPPTTTYSTTLSTTTRSTEKEKKEEVEGEDEDEEEEEVRITTKRPSVHPPFSSHYFISKTTPTPSSTTVKTTTPSTTTAATTTTETTTTTKSPTVATRRPPITTRRSPVVPRRPTTTTRKPSTTTRSTTPTTTEATTTTTTKPATTTTAETERKTRKPLTTARTTTPDPSASTTESRRGESITPFAFRPKLRRVRPSVTSFTSDEDRVRSVVGGHFYPRRRRPPRLRTTSTTTTTTTTTSTTTTTTTTTEAPTTPKAITITTTSTADRSRQTTFRTFLKFTPNLATKKATTPATTTMVDTTSSTTTTTTTSPTTLASSSTLSPDQVVLLSLTEIMRDATHESSDKLTNIRESLDKLNRELAGQDIHIIHAEVDGIEIRLDNESTPIMTLRGPTPTPTTTVPTPTHFDNTTLRGEEPMITLLQDEEAAEEVVKRVHTSMKSSITIHKPEEQDENEVASSTVFVKELEEYATTSAGKSSSPPAKSDLSSTSLAPSREEGVEFDGPTTPQVFKFAETPVVEFGHDERVQVHRTPTGSEGEDENQRKSEGVGMVISATSTSPSSVTTRTRSTTVPVTTHQEAIKPYSFSKNDARTEGSSQSPGGGSEELEIEANDTSEEVKEEATTVRGKLHPTSHLRPVTLPPPRTTADVETSPMTTTTTTTTTTSTSSTSSATPSTTRTTTTTSTPKTSTRRLPAIDVVSVQQEEESHSNDILSGTFEGVVEEVELGAESSASSSSNVVYVIGIIGLLPAAGAAAFLGRKYLKKGQKALPESEERAEGFTPVTNHTRKPSNTNTLDLAAANPVSSSVEARNPKYSPWEFPHAKLRLVSVLGEGNFGIVWKAEARELCACEGNAAPTVLVAVKGVKAGAGHKEKQDLLNELAIMQQLGQHANVVTLLGCCTQQEPYYVIMEYVMCGKLLTFLRDHRTRQNYFNFSSDTEALTSRDLTRFACHVANGCDYLQSRGIIHRDLAARNILVDHNKTCKIADFGLARNVKDLGSDIYEQKSRGALPIRWMAPESLYMNIFTHKSDVWSFGILCWEVVTLGSTPYPGMSAREVMRRVREGYRLDRPDHCRPELYRVVNKCWHQDLNKRPSFSELKHELVSLLDHQTGYIDLENFPESSYYSMLANNEEKL